MKELVQFLAQQLVNNPDAVEVKETQGDTASVLELRVAKEDLGRVIGKQGRTAKSIRTILNAVASRTSRKVVLEIIEEKSVGRCRLSLGRLGIRPRVRWRVLTPRSRRQSWYASAESPGFMDCVVRSDAARIIPNPSHFPLSKRSQSRLAANPASTNS